MVDAKLICNIVKAKTYCTNCHNLYDKVEYGKVCPNCGSDATYLEIGNEVEIKEIAVR